MCAWEFGTMAVKYMISLRYILINISSHAELVVQHLMSLDGIQVCSCLYVVHVYAKLYKCIKECKYVLHINVALVGQQVIVNHSLKRLQKWLQYSPSLNTVTSFPAWILDTDPLEWERATGGKDPDCLIYVAYTLRGFIARFCPQKRHNEELSSFCIMDRFSYTGLCWDWCSGGRETQRHNLLC